MQSLKQRTSDHKCNDGSASARVAEMDQRNAPYSFAHRSSPVSTRLILRLIGNDIE